MDYSNLQRYKSSGQCKTNRQSIMEGIETAIQFCINQLPALCNRIRNKDVVLYLGLTRSGKSALINYCIGTPLQSICHRPNIYKIKKVKEDSCGPTIEQGSQSSTRFPNVYDGDDFLIVDTPGFFDNRGPCQEIINAISLKQMRCASSYKFMFVCDINEIMHDNIDLFIRSVTRLVTLVEFDLSHSLSFIFTKDSFDHTPQDIIAYFNAKIILRPNLNIDGRVRNLLENIICRPELISFFRMPSREGLIVNDELLIGYAEAISASIPLENICINFRVSEVAQHVISETFIEIIDLSYFTELFDFYMTLEDYNVAKNNIARDSLDFIIEKYVYASTEIELDSMNQCANTFNRKIQLELDKKFVTIRHMLNSACILCSIKKLNLFLNKMYILAEFEDIADVQHVIKNRLFIKYKEWLQGKLKVDIDMLRQKIDADRALRTQMDFNFNVETGVGTAGIATGITSGIVGAGVLPAFTAAAAIPIVGLVFAGIGILGGAVSLGLGINTAIQRQRELERRMQERIRQGRPVS